MRPSIKKLFRNIKCYVQQVRPGKGLECGENDWQRIRSRIYHKSEHMETGFFGINLLSYIINLCRLIKFFKAIGTGETKQKTKIDASYNLLVEVKERNKKTIVNETTRVRFATYAEW
jgi:hypothetical protein